MKKELTLSQFASLGGKARAKKRFAGKTAWQISKEMSKLRKGKKAKKI